MYTQDVGDKCKGENVKHGGGLRGFGDTLFTLRLLKKTLGKVEKQAMALGKATANGHRVRVTCARNRMGGVAWGQGAGAASERT